MYSFYLYLLSTYGIPETASCAEHSGKQSQLSPPAILPSRGDRQVKMTLQCNVETQAHALEKWKRYVNSATWDWKGFKRYLEDD